MFWKGLVVFLVLWHGISGFQSRRREDKTKCPHVKSIRNFDLEKLLGSWFVMQYYASSEEALAYRCMRAKFTLSSQEGAGPEDYVTMNFTYSFTDDPINEKLQGNITWSIPDALQPAHWVHSEDIYEGVYNTYILDSDYKSWALLLHCAEKSKSPRYLSSFIMSRESTLGSNVISYLREKLPRYDIDLAFMFPMTQDDCESPKNRPELPPIVFGRKKQQSSRRHPLKRHHKSG